jgi:hypothetical protein
MNVSVTTIFVIEKSRVVSDASTTRHLRQTSSTSECDTKFAQRCDQSVPRRFTKLQRLGRHTQLYEEICAARIDRHSSRDEAIAFHQNFIERDHQSWRDAKMSRSLTFCTSCVVTVATKGLFWIMTVQVHCGGARSAAGSVRRPMREIRRSSEATRPSTPFLPTFSGYACGILATNLVLVSWSRSIFDITAW